MLLSDMNSLHLGIMKFGETKPWGQETRSRGLKVLALAFCRISGRAVPSQQQHLSEKNWELCDLGLVL